jgi:hypothetical protein
MSDTAAAYEEAIGFLATVPLLDGMPEAELAELARLTRRRELPAARFCGARRTKPRRCC